MTYREKRNLAQRKWKSKNPLAFKEWVKKHPAKWMRANMYQNAKKRVTGKLVSGSGKSYWKGLEILSYPEFRIWFSSRKWQFKSLFKKYLNTSKDRCYAPSLHRKNPSVGYISSNLEIIPQGFNSFLAKVK